MPKKKPTKTEARPRKKKAERSPVSKAVSSPRGAAARRGSKEAPSPKTAGGSASRGTVTGKAAAGKAAARSREEKSPKPLAKVKVGARDTAPAAAKAPQKPSKPTRRIPNAELNKIRTFLAQKKIALTNHLQSELSELEKPEKRHRTDLEEIASDTHDTDSLCEIMDIEASQIGQIDMALTKIDNGTYGICEDCGGEIPLIRLEALPFATQCIECKRKAEIEGRISAER